MSVLSEFTIHKINKQINKTKSIVTKLFWKMYRAKQFDDPNGNADCGLSKKKGGKTRRIFHPVECAKVCRLRAFMNI